MNARTWLVCMIMGSALLACGDGDGGGGDDTPAIDANPNAPDAAAPDADPNAPDAAPADGSVGVACGDTVCDPTEECCIEGGTTCVASGTCTGVTVSCDGAEDCPVADQVCCVEVGGPGGGGTECAAASACQNPTCTTADDCPNANQECCTFGNVMACAAQCPGP